MGRSGIFSSVVNTAEIEDQFLLITSSLVKVRPRHYDAVFSADSRRLCQVVLNRRSGLPCDPLVSDLGLLPRARAH